MYRAVVPVSRRGERDEDIFNLRLTVYVFFSMTYVNNARSGILSVLQEKSHDRARARSVLMLKNRGGISPAKESGIALAHFIIVRTRSVAAQGGKQSN